jgi:His-Xaa-Ser system radical SAM maturase HxsB
MFEPLRLRPLANGDVLHVSDSGRFFASGIPFVERGASGERTSADDAWLEAAGHRIDTTDLLSRRTYAWQLARRLTKGANLDYLILVPTLRCNLSCSYCQVSRAPLHQPGFDWTAETLEQILALIDDLKSEHVQIEFQGGEPTLRVDLLQRVIARCKRFRYRRFVVCTNLHEIGDEQWALFDNPDLYISTSLDGDFLTHGLQRTGTETAKFEANLRTVIERYGPNKVSALPTIDPNRPPKIESVIDTYSDLGLSSIFLRPINYQGFARKRHQQSRETSSAWAAYHRSFVRSLIDRNWTDRTRVLEETYLSVCLRRIFHPGAERHVDLRNPNPLGVDYLVIDHDGTLYPTDEARMLARSGVIDLSLGKVGEDWRSETWEQLNLQSTNQFDPACSRCAFQPYCGRDIVDDLARYGRVDIPRTETVFCRRHQDIFDFAFELIYDPDPAVRYSLSRWLRLEGTPDSLGERLS